MTECLHETGLIRLETFYRRYRYPNESRCPICKTKYDVTILGCNICPKCNVELIPHYTKERHYRCPLCKKVW